MTQRTISGRRLPCSSSDFGRDFVAGLLLICVPYGLAVLVQDVVSPALRDGIDGTAIAAVLAMVAAIAGGAVALWRTLSPRPAFGSDGHDADDGMLIAFTHGTAEREVSNVVRRLGTPMRRRFERPGARAERVGTPAPASPARRRAHRADVQGNRLRAVPVRASARPWPPRTFDLRGVRRPSCD